MTDPDPAKPDARVGTVRIADASTEADGVVRAPAPLSVEQLMSDDTDAA